MSTKDPYRPEAGWKPIPKPTPPVCDICGKRATWSHPEGGLRCRTCPRPGGDQDAGNPISKMEFLSMSPFVRGYSVYLSGLRYDQPNIPNETNPYGGTKQKEEWFAGWRSAVEFCQQRKKRGD